MVSLANYNWDKPISAYTENYWLAITEISKFCLFFLRWQHSLCCVDIHMGISVSSPIIQIKTIFDTFSAQFGLTWGRGTRWDSVFPILSLLLSFVKTFKNRTEMQIPHHWGPVWGCIVGFGPRFITLNGEIRVGGRLWQIRKYFQKSK